MINPSIFKAYDIRGIYPKDINEDNFPDIIRAIYTFFLRDMKKTRLSVVLGRDMRLSSPLLSVVTRKTLKEMGAKVIDIGLSSTPTVYSAVLRYKYDCGIQISASHNPKEYNGLKFLKRDGMTLVKISKDFGMDAVKNIAIKKSFAKKLKGGKIISRRNVLSQGVDKILKDYDFTKIKPFTVVADAANSMGAVVLSELFDRIPPHLIKVNFDLNGNFPSHQPDPLQFKNLALLQRQVVKNKADLGIAPDGDSDRVFFVDEKGKIIPATSISSLIAREILIKKPGSKIIVDIRYTRNVIDVCKKYKGVPLISRVGHALITAQLNREGAEFAGESSGHFYYKVSGGAESACRTILYILSVMSREKKPVSKILASLQTSIESGEFNFVLDEGKNAETLLKKLKESYSAGSLLEIDGIAIDFPDWRFSVRASNTEPLVRLNVEGKTKNVVSKYVAELTLLIEKFGATLKK